MTQDDIIDLSVAIQLLRKIGDKVSEDEVIIRVFYNEEKKLEESLKYIQNSWTVSDCAEKRKLIIDRIS